MSELERPGTPSEAWDTLERQGAIPSEHKRRPPKMQGKSVSLVKALKEYVREHPEYMEHVVMGLIHKARQGDVKCAALLFDRLDGAVVRQLETRTEVTHVKRLGFAEPEFEVMDMGSKPLLGGEDGD